MSVSALEQLCRGSFVFLKPEPTEIRRIIPQIDEMLPQPQKIYLQDESATPAIGFPIAQSRALEKLEERFLALLDAEIGAQVAYHTRSSFDSKAYARAWERYRSFLDQVLDNATVSSVGHRLRGHLLAVALGHGEPGPQRPAPAPAARPFGGRPGARRRRQVQGLSSSGSTGHDLTYDIAQRLAPEMEVGEDELFPAHPGTDARQRPDLH